MSPGLHSQIDPHALPTHVAIIMDGNGRWASDRGLERIEGHREGARSVRDIVRATRELGIKYLTLFAFSEQNWQRPKIEVGQLMELLHEYVLTERGEILDNNIRLHAVGELERLPGLVRAALNQLSEESTKRPYKTTLTLALSYGGREDILHAAQSLARKVADGKLEPNEIDEDTFVEHLWSKDLPPLDLLIRTSGELRISNFMLWQAAYAEFIFVHELWPDFRREQLYRAIADYQTRERRFGLTSEQVA